MPTRGPRPITFTDVRNCGAVNVDDAPADARVLRASRIGHATSRTNVLASGECGNYWEN